VQEYGNRYSPNACQINLIRTPIARQVLVTADIQISAFHAEQPIIDFVTYVTYPSKQPSYSECDAVLIMPLDRARHGGSAIMRKPKFLDESTLSLEIRGCEVNTARDVFVLKRELDAILEHLLEANGYVHHTNIVLSDGQIIDGWVKV
jgi:hypothetical protein